VPTIVKLARLVPWPAGGVVNTRSLVELPGGVMAGVIAAAAKARACALGSWAACKKTKTTAVGTTAVKLLGGRLDAYWFWPVPACGPLFCSLAGFDADNTFVGCDSGWIAHKKKLHSVCLFEDELRPSADSSPEVTWQAAAAKRMATSNDCLWQQVPITFFWHLLCKVVASSNKIVTVL
jgi:hypothetical protein